MASYTTMESVRKLDVSATVSLVVAKLNLSNQEAINVEERFSACKINGSRFLKLTREGLAEVFPGDINFGIRQDLHGFLSLLKDESTEDFIVGATAATPNPTPCVSPVNLSSDTESPDSEPQFSPPSLPVPLKRQNAVVDFQSPGGSDVELGAHSQIPEELGKAFKLPKYFGLALDKKLKRGDQLTSRELNAFIDIVRTHVWVECPEPSVSTRKWLARKLVQNYPALALKHPYESLKKMGLSVPSEVPKFQPELEVFKKLSRAFENKRHSLKKRFSDQLTDTTDDDSQDEFNEDAESNSAVDKHHNMLLKAIANDAPKDVLNDLFMRSFRKRKMIILDFPANRRIEQALKKYPPLGDAEQLCADMLMSMKEQPDAAKMQTMEKNFKTHSKSLIKLMLATKMLDGEPEDVEFVSATNLSRVFHTPRRKSSNTNCQQLLITQKDEDNCEVSTPFLLLTSKEVILMGKTDCPILRFKRDQIGKAVVGLCAVYYAFQLEYPSQAANAYAFLDEFVVNGENTNKTSSYLSQVSRYARFLAGST